jgi:branched-chain amino acid transport system permease protein
MSRISVVSPEHAVSTRPASVWATIGIAISAVVLVVLPFVVPDYLVFQGTLLLVYAIALLGLNILVGYNGQLSLGHSAFYAIGAYCTAIAMDRFGVPYWLTVPLAAGVCFVFGFLMGFPALRLGSIYLALATFALALATPQLLKYKKLEAWTGGTQGIILNKPDSPISFSIAGVPLNEDRWMYLLTLAVAGLLFWLAANLLRGRIGRALVAIRDHPIAAAAMGINLPIVKSTTFGVSAAYTGIAGALSAMAIGFVSPDSYPGMLSITMLVGVVVGGLASIPGAFLGAIFILIVPDFAEQISKSAPSAIYGLLLIGVMLVMPTGIAGAIRNLWRSRLRSKSE